LFEKWHIRGRIGRACGVDCRLDLDDPALKLTQEA